VPAAVVEGKVKVMEVEDHVAIGNGGMAIETEPMVVPKLVPVIVTVEPGAAGLGVMAAMAGIVGEPITRE